ncbi:MAG TPA: nucleotide disphospho-sugar-binding domain-containing protein [Terriglobales bacterium]|nr:nucleotide disphospho-sugar-binding domain-containing protein [Terriglobales bacterium]
MTTLARKLQSRGHDVVFISLADVAPFVEAAGLPFVPCSEAAYPAGSLGKLVRRLSELSGEDALHFTVNSMMKGYTASLFESLPDTLSKAGVDGIVLDQYQPYVELIPMHLRMPFVHVSNALHVDYTGRTPICFVDWPHEPGVDALARNIEGVRRARILLEPVTATAQVYAREVGLSLDWNNPHSTLSPLAWVTQCPRKLDFGCAPDFPQFHYAGPFHDGRGRMDFDFPWQQLTGEPIVYASMGTLQNGLVDIFRSIAQAAIGLRELQFVLAVGGQLDPKQLGAVPANVMVVSYAPQIEVLKRSSLCITHAGLNTALESLSNGVPMLALPITNDQPGVAARIANKKVGVVLSPDHASPQDFVAAINQVLGDSTVRENVQRVQEAIRSTDGLSIAAGILERAFDLGEWQRRPNVASECAPGVSS